MLGFHHLRSRALLSGGLEPFPAKGALKRFLDRLMYAVGVLAPFALLPQAVRLYATKSSAGISLATWVLLALSNILWLMYGIVHKDKPIIIAHSLFIVMDASIIAGALAYSDVL